jgi:hypothetical protein
VRGEKTILARSIGRRVFDEVLSWWRRLCELTYIAGLRRLRESWVELGGEGF